MEWNEWVNENECMYVRKCDRTDGRMDEWMHACIVGGRVDGLVGSLVHGGQVDMAGQERKERKGGKEKERKGKKNKTKQASGDEYNVLYTARYNK